MPNTICPRCFKEQERPQSCDCELPPRPPTFHPNTDVVMNPIDVNPVITKLRETIKDLERRLTQVERNNRNQQSMIRRLQQQTNRK